MTSLLLKKPRTTPPRRTARRTGISLAVLAAAAAGASAQAPTTWRQFDEPKVQARAAPQAVPQLPPLGPPPASPVVTPPGATLRLADPVSPTPGVMVRPPDRPPTVPVLPATRPTEQPVPAYTTGQTSGALGPRARSAEQIPDDKKGGTGNTPEPPAAALPDAPGKLPNKDEVFRLDNDLTLNMRILRDLGRLDKDGKVDKDVVRVPPAKLVPDGADYQPKTSSYPPVKVLLEPNYVVHRRLYFEERNAERFGWDAGPAQAVISTLYFYKDTLLWPHYLVAGGCKERYDTSAGKCLPGSPTPYYLYPPGVTLGGSLFEAGIIIGTVAIFP